MLDLYAFSELDVSYEEAYALAVAEELEAESPYFGGYDFEAAEYDSLLAYYASDLDR